MSWNALSIQYINEHIPPPPSAPPPKGEDHSVIGRKLIVEIKGVEPLLICTLTRDFFSVCVCELACSVSGCKYTTLFNQPPNLFLSFFDPFSLENKNQISNQSNLFMNVALISKRLQIYNVFLTTSKLILKKNKFFLKPRKYDENHPTSAAIPTLKELPLATLSPDIPAKRVQIYTPLFLYA